MSRMDRMATNPSSRLGSPLEALSWNLRMNSQKVCCEVSAPVKNWFRRLQPIAQIFEQVAAREIVSPSFFQIRRFLLLLYLTPDVLELVQE